MRIGVTLTNAGDTAANAVDATIETAREAADAGLRTAWLGQRFDWDSPALAGLVGRAVPELELGTSAIPIFGRHPLTVAASAQTAQAATHGRYHLALALGAKEIVEGAYGIEYARPVAVLREYLTALRAAFAGQEHHGELVTAAAPWASTMPGGESVPVLVAAMGPQALEVTGELADGTVPLLAGPRALGDHIVPQLARAAQRAGRPDPRVVAVVPGALTSDVDSAREVFAEHLSWYERIPSYRRAIGLSGAERAGELAVLGDEAVLREQVRRYFDAGATEVVFSSTELLGEQTRSRTLAALGALRG